MEHPFTIKFQCITKFRDSPCWWEKQMKDATPESVTYKGLFAYVKDSGYCAKRMWYDTRCDEDGVPMFDGIEIKSDEQVKEMVQLASKRGFIELHVMLGVDCFWKIANDDDTISLLREGWAMKTHVHSNEDGAEWHVSRLDEDYDENENTSMLTMKTDVCSNEDGAERDVSGPNEVLDSATVGESQKDGNSSIDDCQSELGDAEYLEATGNRRQTGDRKIGHCDSVDGGKAVSMENRKEWDETGEPAVQNVVQSIHQRREGVEHYEISCGAATEVEDQIDISSVKTDKAVETDRVSAKRGRGSGTRRASNPGRDPAIRGRARGIASSSRNSKATRPGKDAASSSLKHKASDSGRGLASSSQNGAILSTGRGRGRGSTLGDGTTSSSGRGRGSSSRKDTTKASSSLRLGTDKGSSSADAESKTSRS